MWDHGSISDPLHIQAEVLGDVQPFFLNIAKRPHARKSHIPKHANANTALKFFSRIERAIKDKSDKIKKKRFKNVLN